MTASDPWLQGVCAVLVLVLPSLAIARVRQVHRSSWIAAGTSAAVVAMAVAVMDASLGLRNDPPAVLLDAAAAASVTAIVVVLTAHRRGNLHSAVQSACWGVLALAPLLIVSVSAVPSLLQRTAGALDAGGVIATHVAPAAAVLAAALVPVRRPSRGPLGAGTPPVGTPEVSPRASTQSSRARTAIAVALLAAAGVAWMVGVERVLSVATGRLAVNAAVGVLLGAVVWLLIARIVGRPSPGGGALLGGALGWAAIGAGGAFLAPPALVAATVIGSAAGAALFLRRHTGANPLARGAGAALLAAAVGGTVVGLLADGQGLAATGSILGVAAQLVALAVAILVSGAIALLAWLFATLVARLLKRSS